MRFGCCLNMVATGPDKTGFEHLGTLKESGFDYVELPLAEMMALSDETYAQLRQALRQYDVPCEVCNNFFPTTMRLTGPDADPSAAMDYVHKALRRAGELGVEYVVFGSGKAKNVPEGFSRERAYEQVTQLLQDISPVAGTHGISIAIEPLRKAECNLINTFEEGCRLARDVSRPNIRVLVDFYHLTVEAEPPARVRELGREYLGHVHFANPTGRVYPLREDEADYLPFMRALHAAGYDGRISCEAYTDDFQVSAPLARNLLCAVCQAGKESLCNTVRN